jgi:hypothetical protein
MDRLDTVTSIAQVSVVFYLISLIYKGRPEIQHHCIFLYKSLLDVIRAFEEVADDIWAIVS